jgi:rare lipoprotein A
LIGNRRANAYAVVLLLSGVLAIPSLAWAGSGGSSVSPSGGASSGLGAGSGQGASAQPGNTTVTSTSNGVTLTTSTSTMLRNGLSFSGITSPSAAGETIEIDRLGHETNWQWAATVTATVASDGSFSAVWPTNHIGRFSIRALISQPASANAASTAPTVTVTVYRQAIATQYGPGFYGQRTACGNRLGPNTIGVASRTLKCGTKVAVYYGGRTMVVPVIDRGPYANGADWDLTEATARALGIAGTARIGAVSLPPQPALP